MRIIRRRNGMMIGCRWVEGKGTIRDHYRVTKIALRAYFDNAGARHPLWLRAERSVSLARSAQPTRNRDGGNNAKFSMPSRQGREQRSRAALQPAKGNGNADTNSALWPLDQAVGVGRAV
jgi:hypothetical protein